MLWLTIKLKKEEKCVPFAVDKLQMSNTRDEYSESLEHLLLGKPHRDKKEVRQCQKLVTKAATVA